MSMQTNLNSFFAPQNPKPKEEKIPDLKDFLEELEIPFTKFT